MSTVELQSAMVIASFPFPLRVPLSDQDMSRVLRQMPEADAPLLNRFMAASLLGSFVYERIPKVFASNQRAVLHNVLRRFHGVARLPANGAAFQRESDSPAMACRLLICVSRSSFGGTADADATAWMDGGLIGCCASALLPFGFPFGAEDARAATAPIVASPGALVLKTTQGQTATGTLTLKKTSSDQHTYYLSTNQSWIWMNPPYGSTQTISAETDQLVITVQTTGLAVGTHAAVVYISESGPNNFNTMLRVPVTMTVTAGDEGGGGPGGNGEEPEPKPLPDGPIQVTPASLILSSASPVGTLTLRKGGPAKHSYSLSANQSWIWMNPPYGSSHTIAAETDQLAITAKTTGMAAGTYSGVVYIVDSGPNNYSNTIRIPITVTIKGQDPDNGNDGDNVQPNRSATISWTANTEADLAGYRLYVGTRSGVYSLVPHEVVGPTSFTLPNLAVGTTYYFAVTAFDKTNHESAKSGELSKSVY
ncbi:MAG: exported protein of unknown function [Nitrospira sp.]|jgi:hypothetical protein|nr:exported protein of unknown function [Nitrospira sp.]